MEYMTAKRLKDAGWPQYGENREVDGGLVRMQPQFGDTFDIDCYVPTLRELIAACGEKFQKLLYRRKRSVWVAFAVPEPRNDDKGQPHPLMSGLPSNSPSEAVAELWLVLMSQK